MNEEMKKWCDSRYQKHQIPEITVLEIIISIVISICFILEIR